jgi:hypothetical protein
MTACTSHVNHLDSHECPARRAALRSIRCVAAWLGRAGVAAAGLGFAGWAASAATAQDYAGQEHVVSDMPSVLADETDLPLESIPFETTAIETLPDESDASEYAISDGWMPQMMSGPAASGPRWTAQIDALFLFMGNIPKRPVYIDDASGRTALDVQEANPAMSAAPRYALIWHRDDCRAFELNYFAVGSFAGIAESIAPPGATFSSVGLGGVPFNDVLGAAAETTSGIKSWEFNLRKNTGGPITWIAGFRWVEWTQQLATIGVFDNGGLPGLDFYGVETGNNLYGGQLGADIMLWNRGDRIRINGLAKGGVYYNYQAWQRTRIFSESAALDTAVGASKDTTSFLGEVGLTGEYRIFNWLSWRAGYTVLWLGGVANAANQLARSDFAVDPPTAGVSPYSSVLLHGATTGLEARW